MRIYARRRLKRYWSWLLLLILLCLGLLCVAVLLLLQGLTNMPGAEFVAVDLQSELEADYRVDENRPRLPGVRFDLLWDTIADRDPDTLNLAARQAALENSLLTPVPTVTPPGSCRGVHFVYAVQDTWLDAANPTTGDGGTIHLSVGQAQGKPRRLFLYFPVTDVLPPGTTIHSARLEMDVAQAGHAEDLRFWSLSAPFDEQDTTWANQPQPVSAYRTKVLASGPIHVWDATVMVRDWLSRQQPNNGLMLEYSLSVETTVAYYSREIISRVEEQNGRIGPRLVINCGHTPATAISLNSPHLTPSPATTPNPVASGTPAATLPLQTPTLQPPTPTVAPTLLPSPSPSAVPPTPTALPPTPTVLPTLTALPPTPTSPPPPPPTPTPSQDNDDDNDDDDNNDNDDDDGSDETPPPPSPSPPPSPTPLPSSTPPLLFADLSVTKSVDNPTPLIGETVTFTVIIANAGPLEATSVQLRDLLPPGLIFVSATPSQGSYNETTGLWSVGTIANSGTTLLTVTTMAVNNVPVTNVAQIVSVDQPDLDSSPDNNVDIEDDQASVLVTSTLPTLTINDVTVTEGDSGVVTATFTVLLSQSINLPVTVDYGAVDNTATAPADYGATSGTLIFPPGTTSQTFTVQVQGDTIDEVMEIYDLTLSNAVNATIADGAGQGTILDDDNPTLSISDATLIEGDLGSVSAVFTLTLSTVGVETATVNFNAADITALAPADYAATTGSVTFPPGLTQQTITIPVQGDVVVEGNETFAVNLSNPVNVTIADGQGLGLIIDDDSGPSPCDAPLTILPAIRDTSLRSNQPNDNRGLSTLLETKPAPSRRHALIQFDTSAILPGTTIFCAALVLNQLSPPDTNQAINVHRVTTAWVEGDGPPGTTGATWNQPDKGAVPNWASPGGDFDPAAVGSFTPNAAIHTVNVTALAQFWVDNPGQNLGLLLNPQTLGSNGAIDYASREDGVNQPPYLVIRAVPDLSVTDVSIMEGNSGSTTLFFDVTLSPTSTQTVTVAYTTADGTATGTDNDYVPVSGLLTFPPGTITQTIAVTINGDLKSEGDETFFVNLSSPVNSGLVDGQAVGTIINDESGGM